MRKRHRKKYLEEPKYLFFLLFPSCYNVIPLEDDIDAIVYNYCCTEKKKIKGKT